MRGFVVALSVLLSVAATCEASDLTGVVVAANSTPLPGAQVYVHAAFPRTGTSAVCPNCYRDCGKHEQADARGSFRLEGLDDTLLFDLLAVADGYEPAFAHRVDPKRGPVSITLNPRSTTDADRLITGVVLDPEAKPLAGAIVEPNGYRFERPLQDGRFASSVGYGNIPGVEKLSITNARGEFALRIPDPRAKLDVRVRAIGLAPKIERMLAPGETRTIHLGEGAAISGRVERNGTPVAGARVVFVQRNRASSEFLGSKEIGTNDAGQFMITELGPNETYVVHVPMQSIPDGVIEPKVVAVGDAGTTTDAGTLAILRGRGIAGRVVVPTCESIPAGARIMIANDLSDDSRSIELRADGTFDLQGVTNQSVVLMIRVPGLDISPESFSSSPRLFPAPPEKLAAAMLPAGSDETGLRLVLRKARAYEQNSVRR